MDVSLDRVNDVFRRVFQDPELNVARETTAQDVEGWDSLMHVTLIVTIEKTFAIRFKSSEVAGLQNVGEMLDMVNARLASK